LKKEKKFIDDKIEKMTFLKRIGTKFVFNDIVSTLENEIGEFFDDLEEEKNYPLKERIKKIFIKWIVKIFMLLIFIFILLIMILLLIYHMICWCIRRI